MAFQRASIIPLPRGFHIYSAGFALTQDVPRHNGRVRASSSGSGFRKAEGAVYFPALIGLKGCFKISLAFDCIDNRFCLGRR